MPTRSDNRARALQWADWRCCLCRSPGGADIDVYPLDRAVSDDVIPLCPTCAAALRSGGDGGFSVDELRTRRDQVFDECTRHLVPPVHVEITQEVRGGGTRSFPDVGFVLRHLGDSLPVRVFVNVSAPEHRDEFALDAPLYNGERPWRLNPRASIHGQFEVPVGFRSPQSPLTLEVAVSIRDALDREHALLPSAFTYVPHGNFWYAQP